MKQTIIVLVGIFLSMLMGIGTVNAQDMQPTPMACVGPIQEPGCPNYQAPPSVNTGNQNSGVGSNGQGSVVQKTGDGRINNANDPYAVFYNPDRIVVRGMNIKGSAFVDCLSVKLPVKTKNRKVQGDSLASSKGCQISVSLYLLDSGELQINIIDLEGKLITYTFVYNP